MKPKLLLVEDSPAARAQLVEALQSEFEIVAEASTGIEAVEMCELHQPELLLLDLALPAMNGLDALRLIQARVRPMPRVVILSGVGAEQTALDALEAGAHEYLLKPVSLSKIAQALRGLLRQAA